jgi:hypothetical protein
MSGRPALERVFDRSRMRRYLGGSPSIVCPHEAAVSLTKDALESGGVFGAAGLLHEAAEESAYLALKTIFISSEISGKAERIAMAQEHFRSSGLGTLTFDEVSPSGGKARMTTSPFDESWISSYGKSRAPVNVIVAGYVAGAFAVISGQGMKTFTVEETAGIARGDPESVFIVARRTDKNG